MDVPYRVERKVAVEGYSVAVISYAITRTGEGVVATCKDPVLAYKIVDALNKLKPAKPTRGSDDSPSA